MQDSQIRRMPTGITSLDPILDGGIPVGSVILLLGEIGAGHYEYVYSSLINTLDRLEKIPPDTPYFPTKMQYITFTRLESDVRHEIMQSFSQKGPVTNSGRIQFDDLSDLYFDRSIVPDSWYSHSDTLSRLQQRGDHANVFVKLSELFNQSADGSLIIMDSLTEIATQCSYSIRWQDLAGFLRGVQRYAKKKDCTVYLLMSKGILPLEKEREIADIVDAVFLFRWEESTASRRQRIMFFEKFRGVMPHLVEQDLVKFAVRISTTDGFEVSNIRMVI
ncbi:MAG: hypothetical protein WC342_01295 [Methanoregula sp.]|jgi:KaiC/GvpD/RAD55 family RecA-like ATPase